MKAQFNYILYFFISLISVNAQAQKMKDVSDSIFSNNKFFYVTKEIVGDKERSIPWADFCFDVNQQPNRHIILKTKDSTIKKEILGKYSVPIYKSNKKEILYVFDGFGMKVFKVEDSLDYILYFYRYISETKSYELATILELLDVEDIFRYL